MPSNGAQQPRTLIGGYLAHRERTAWPAELSSYLATGDYGARRSAHSDGLCSAVYRVAQADTPAVWPYQHLTASSSVYDGLAGWLCIKRVEVEEQPAPHSVQLEVQLLDRLVHPGIGPLIAAFQDTSDPFGTTIDLIMPLYAATLTEVLQEPSLIRGHVGQTETLRPGNSLSHLWTCTDTNTTTVDSFVDFCYSVTQQLLSALDFLKSQNVAHRDIKPSNILLAPSGQVRLIDLGTAFAPDVAEETPMVCQVGTGIFRAPELLFAPTKGYDAFAVDLWAMALTLCHFLTPLLDVRTPLSTVAADEDERPDWQRALEDGQPLNDLNASPSSIWSEEFLPPPAPTSPSGFLRTQLFDAERGDISLAASIFNLLGLPTTISDWPEAEFFQPPLHKLPFAPRQPRELKTALPLLETLVSNPDTSPTAKHKLECVYTYVLVPALSLSAHARPSAAQMLSTLVRNRD